MEGDTETRTVNCILKDDAETGNVNRFFVFLCKLYFDKKCAIQMKKICIAHLY